MKLKEYREHLNKLIKRNPQALDYEVIMASDDEGNSYQKVIYGATLMQVENLDDYNLEVVEGKDFNTVCIN